jgi:hypothetical protein
MRKVAPSGKVPVWVVTPNCAKAVPENDRKRMASTAKCETRLMWDDMMSSPFALRDGRMTERNNGGDRAILYFRLTGQASSRLTLGELDTTEVPFETGQKAEARETARGGTW